MTPRSPPLFAQPLEVWERDGVKAALAKVGLATEDVCEPGPMFWRFEQADMPVGFGGLEWHGRDALLRSVVTFPRLRRRGLGGAIVAALEAEAGLRKCRAVYLLTNKAEYFKTLGYSKCARSRVPSAIRKSRQFAQLCPASATAMVKKLN